ncbi:MAG: bifunctional RNase H/acid phosphatase [Micrococcales bacterium]|nr:bifunctional RNase H/acid phosphatase [Micrococcales bacterium]
MSRELIIEADGGSRGNPGPAGFGALVRDGKTGAVLCEEAGFIGHATNNVAEYRGLIAGIEAARQIDATARLDIRLDSKLLVNQMSGQWKLKSPELKVLAKEAKAALGEAEASFRWVPREDNTRADALANEAMDRESGLSHVTGAGLVEPTQATDGNSLFESHQADALPLPELRQPESAPFEPTVVMGDFSADVGDLASGVRLAQMTTSGTQRRLGTPGEPTTVILVRHGMTEVTASDAFAGAAIPGASLSQEGRAQAAAAAEELKRMLAVPWVFVPRPTVAFTSPTARTVETAQLVAPAIGLEAKQDRTWIEEDFGQWDSLTKVQTNQRWPNGLDQWYQDPEYAPPGGESRAQVGRRIWQALNQLVANHPGQSVLLVTHGMAIRAALGAALGAPPAAWFAFRVAPASITVLRLWPGGLSEVVCTNRTVAAN